MNPRSLPRCAVMAMLFCACHRYHARAIFGPVGAKDSYDIALVDAQFAQAGGQPTAKLENFDQLELVLARWTSDDHSGCRPEAPDCLVGIEKGFRSGCEAWVTHS